MKAKAFQFGGACEGCRRGGQHRRAVEVDTGDHSVWLCSGCARRLAKKIVAAADKADANVKANMEYRHDAWGARKAMAKRCSSCSRQATREERLYREGKAAVANSYENLHVLHELVNDPKRKKSVARFKARGLQPT